MEKLEPKMWSKMPTYMYSSRLFSKGASVTPKVSREEKEWALRAAVKAIINRDHLSLEDILLRHPGMVNCLDSSSFSLLHWAARYNFPSAVECLLKHGADVSIRNPENVTPLHTAGRHGASDCVEQLVSGGARVSHVDEEGNTALHLAARKGHVKTCTVLLEYGADPNAERTDRSTPLHMAAINGDVGTIQVLVNKGANIKAADVNGSTSLMFAAAEGHVPTIEHIFRIERENTGTLAECVHQVDKEGATVLHVAVQNGQLEAAKVLIQEHANINATKNDESTPLHVACSLGFDQIVAELLERGADCNAKDWEESTPLHRATSGDYLDIVKTLLKRGCNVNAVDLKQVTPLALAASKGYTEISKSLIEAGADVTSGDLLQRSSLHLATKNSHLETVKVLVQHGGKSLLEQGTRYEETALHYAAGCGNKEILDYLLTSGASASARDHNERSPLHLAAIQGDVACVSRLLLASASQTNDHDDDGMTPLLVASHHGNLAALKLLVDRGADMSHRDEFQNTAVILAAKGGHIDCVSYLIEQGCNIDHLNRAKNSALHLAGENGHEKIIELLLDHGAPHTRNSQEQTPLDVAIDNGQTAVVMTYITHDSWRTIMNNRNSKGFTPMDKLIKRIPEAAQTVLNQSMKTSHTDLNHPNLILYFDYTFVDPGPDDEASRKSQYNALNTMVRYHRADLLAHPLSQTLLNSKWRRFPRYVFYGEMLMYLCFLIFLCVWLIQNNGYLVNSSNVDPQGCIIPNSSQQNSTELNYYLSNNQEREQVSDPSSIVATVVIYSFVIFFALKELVTMFLQGWRYFLEPFHYLVWVVYITSMMFVYPPLEQPCLTNWQGGVAAVFSSWIYLLSYMRCTSLLGVYIMMYTSVVYSVLKVILIFFFLIIGFALGFYIMLVRQDAFNEVGRSISKTLVMMTGEFDFGDIFIDSNNDPFGSEALVFFVIYMLFLPVAFMNLLVGIAVGDIAEIRSDATTRQQALLLGRINEMESLLPRSILRRVYQGKGRTEPNRHKERWWYTFLSEIGYRSETEYITGSGDDIQKTLEEQSERLCKLETSMNEQMELLKELRAKLKQ